MRHKFVDKYEIRKFKIQVSFEDKFEVEDEATILIAPASFIEDEIAPLLAVREFTAGRGFRLSQNSFDYEGHGQWLMSHEDGTMITVVEL